MFSTPNIIGITGTTGSGKTGLVVRVIPIFIDRGYRVASVKHAHHNFDIDQPGKDSYEHRAAGATEVIVSSTRRWAIIHENKTKEEPTLDELLTHLSPTDFIFVEGFKSEPHPKIEVYRPTLGKKPLYEANNTIVAIASDKAVPEAKIPVIDLNNATAVTEFIVSKFPMPIPTRETL